MDLWHQYLEADKAAVRERRLAALRLLVAEIIAVSRDAGRVDRAAHWETTMAGAEASIIADTRTDFVFRKE